MVWIVIGFPSIQRVMTPPVRGLVTRSLEWPIHTFIERLNFMGAMREAQQRDVIFSAIVDSFERNVRFVII